MKTNGNNKKMIVVLLILFAGSVMGIIKSGGLVNTRSIDVLQLFAAGILFGLLIQGLAVSLKKPADE